MAQVTKIESGAADRPDVRNRPGRTATPCADTMTLVTYYRSISVPGGWDLEYIPVWVLRSRPSTRWNFNEELIKPVHGGRCRWVTRISVGPPLRCLPVRATPSPGVSACWSS